MPRKPRDIYKGRHDAGFNADKDVDLAHLREIMGTEDVDAMNYNFYGIYLRNIIRIMLDSHHFRGYPEDVKMDIESEALIDGLKARTKFDGAKFPAPTAPFNYLYRICYHSAQHVLTNYYKMQVKMVPASQCGAGTKFVDGSDFDTNILDKAPTDWGVIKEHLS